MKVFISYARADGAQFAARLEKDLRTARHEPWLDLSRAEGGVSWTDRVEAAIDASGAVLAILTPAAYRSPVCRAEHLRALRKGKRVVPILAAPLADRPLHLEHLAYRDFTGSYREALREILADLSDSNIAPLPSAWRQTFVKLPPRPPHSVDRPDELAKAKAVLLAEDSRNTVGITALRGLGGIGKTVLANLIARDPVVQEAFPDGILWFDVGREPSGLASQLLELGRQLEGVAFSREAYSTLEASTNRLRELLPNKAILLILDDVWDPADVRPLLFESSRCRTLLTTREARIVSALGASEVRLGSLSPEQSLQMIRSWAGRDDPLLGEVAASLGHLPLGLRIAGARLKEGLSTKEWLADFTPRLSRIRLTRRSVSRDESVEACFSLSLDGFAESERRLFYALGAFPEDLPILKAQVKRLWSALAPAMTLFECNDLLEEFSRAALLEISEDQEVVLHDLVHQYALERLGSDVENVINTFLGTYRPQGKGWHEVPDDGHIHRHLAWYLTQLGGGLEACALLGNYAWLETRLKSGPVSELLSDYERLDPGHPLRAAQAALHLAAPILTAFPEALASQLLGRLLDNGAPEVQELCRQAASASRRQWLRPIRASLAQPGGALQTTLIGHSKPVRTVAVARGGEKAISASDDGTLRVWDLASGVELHRLASEEPPGAVAVTKDGERVASLMVDGELNVWDVGTASRVYSAETLQRRVPAVPVLAVTPDGRRAIGSSGKTFLTVWDLRPGTAVRTLRGHTDCVRALVVTADGKRAVSASDDGTLRVWDLDEGKSLHQLVGHRDWVRAVAVCADGRLAVSASDDRTVRVWDLNAGVELHVLRGHQDWVTAVVVEPSGTRAVSGADDGSLRVWNLSEGTLIHELPGHKDAVVALAPTPDGRGVVSASRDGTLKLWSLDSGALLRDLTGHGNAVASVAITPDGRLAVSGSADRTLKVWDLARAAIKQPRHRGQVRSLAASPNGRLVASASDDGTIKVWDLDTVSERSELVGHKSPVVAVAFSPGGERVVSGADDGSIKLWALPTGREICELAGHRSPVKSVAITRDGMRLVSSADDATVKAWDLASGAEVCDRIDHGAWGVRVLLAPDGRRALLVPESGSLKLWNLVTGSLKELPGRWPGAATPDWTRVVVSECEDELEGMLLRHQDSLIVWSPPRGARRQVRLPQAATAVALADNGRRCVAALRDHTVNVWDEGLRELRVLEGHTATVHALAVAPDGAWAASASEDSSLRVWDLNAGRMSGVFYVDAPLTCVARARGLVVAGDRSGAVHVLVAGDPAQGGWLPT